MADEYDNVCCWHLQLATHTFYVKRKIHEICNL